MKKTRAPFVSKDVDIAIELRAQDFVAALALVLRIEFRQREDGFVILRAFFLSRLQRAIAGDRQEDRVAFLRPREHRVERAQYGGALRRRVDERHDIARAAPAQNDLEIARIRRRAAQRRRMLIAIDADDDGARLRRDGARGEDEHCAGDRERHADAPRKSRRKNRKSDHARDRSRMTQKACSARKPCRSAPQGFLILRNGEAA